MYSRGLVRPRATTNPWCLVGLAALSAISSTGSSGGATAFSFSALRGGLLDAFRQGERGAGVVDPALAARSAADMLNIASRHRAPAVVELEPELVGQSIAGQAITLPWDPSVPTVSREGRVRVRGQGMWYKIVAKNKEHLNTLERSGSKLPVVVVHGGPGVPHDYLESLQDLAKTGRPVILYDQFGCGLSASPPDDAFYGVENLRRDLFSLLGHLRDRHGLRGFHLLGQSWGGCLALETAMSEEGLPEGVDLASVITAGTPSRVALVEEVVEEMIQSFKETRGVGPEVANRAFQMLHFCKLDPWPTCLTNAYAKAGTVFRGAKAVSSWGVDERALQDAFPAGTPFLSIRGEHDFVTDTCVKPLLRGIPGARAAVMLGCTHMAHLEQPGLFCVQVSNFMAEAEGARRMLGGGSGGGRGH